MQAEQPKRKLPDDVYNEMLKFFRRTSLPRIQRQRELEKTREKTKEENTPSENKR